MIKIVFFDFDGVLTLHGHACSEICSYLEPVAKIPAAKIEPVFHQIAKQLLVNGKKYQDYIGFINDKLGTSLSVEEILEAVRKTKLNQGMIDIIHDLKRHHVRVGFLTDNNKDRLEMIRGNPEFSNLSPIIGSSEIGCTKDKCRDIFIDALKQANVKPEESIFIDNKKECLIIPKKIGFHTYFHDEVKNNVEDFRKFLHNYDLI